MYIHMYMCEFGGIGALIGDTLNSLEILDCHAGPWMQLGSDILSFVANFPLNAFENTQRHEEETR